MHRFSKHLCALAFAGLALGAFAQQPKKVDEIFAAAPQRALEEVLKLTEPPMERWDEVLRATHLAHGDAALLIKALDEAAKAAAPNSEAKREALRGLAHVQHREGRLSEALAKVDEAIAIRRTDELALLRAQLLDGLDKVDDALTAYSELRAETKDPALIARIGLRAAMLDALKSKGTKTAAAVGASGAASVGAIGRAVVVTGVAAGGISIAAVPALPATRASVAGAPATGFASTSSSEGAAAIAVESADDPESALFAFASNETHDLELRNRAAVVLAMLDRPREAIRLFQSQGEGADLFRSEIRLAEWALNAKSAKDAQEHAWRARSAATLKRDRLYALTVLVEAHRTDDSLGALIERFAAEPKLDDESRHVWIDLLRETARIDEALELFRRSGEGSFTPEMRRELLEMCREAGREDVLIATYGELIAGEPDRLEWREGLSRYWLERGRREEAQAVWPSYLERFSDSGHLIAAANSTRDLGLDDIALTCAQRCIANASDPAGALQARMFLFDFEMRHGRVEAALEQLEAFDREAEPTSPLRVQLSEAFERAGNKKRAAQVLEKIRELRGADEAEEDLEMRLAWLLSEVGDEKTALDRWRNLWRRVASVPRRRQVEDRLMATASRLGSLSDIAVELEEKLAEGKADDRDASLLVRLYQKVGDPASAAEVIGEHMKQAGADPIATLTEKARVFLGGKDYYHFEKTVRKLIELDPENRADHLRQLAMSNLERGKPQEARAVLVQLASEESPSDAAEFEAGVLALAGLNDEAAKTYRKGIAAHPERIDTYLLLANAMRTLSQTDRAIGMFQYLAENAEKDDLFTVAIDGILNMRAKPSIVRWALRVTLERLAGRHDKMYLYQLASDLYDELKDNDGKMRALESSLAIAGEQRASVLRELMDVSQGQASNSYTVVNGMLVQRHEGGDDKKRLAYGRRLIGLGDLVPPAVYLDLGESFLRSGEVANASKTFSMARDVPDYAAFQRQVAQSFESQQFVENALAIYERAMASQGIDVSLLLKTGELHEQLGRDERACEMYQRGIELLLARHPLVASLVEKKPEEETGMYDFSVKNIGDFEQYFGPLERGFIATANATSARVLFDAQHKLLEEDLRAAAARPAVEGETSKLAGFPRIQHRAELLRRLAFAFDFVPEIGAIDLALVDAFPEDDGLLGSLCDERTRLGFTAEAQRLAQQSHVSDDVRAKALARIGVAGAEVEHAQLGLADVVSRLLPILIEGDRAKASSLLRGVQLGETKKEDLPQLQLLLSAALFLDDSAAIVSLGRHDVRAIVQHAKSWEEQRQIDALLKRARAALDRDSYGLIVDALVESISAKKEAFQSYSHLLTQLQRDLGRPLFPLDDLRKRMEDCLPDETYLLTNLLELAPMEQRLEVLQSIWPKVPATGRSDVALGVLSTCVTAAPADLTEFIAGAFESGLEKLDDPRMLTYELRNAFDSSEANIATVLRLLELVHAKYPANLTFTALLAAAHKKLGHDAPALAAMREALPLIAPEEEQWTAQEAGQSLVDAFVPAQADVLLAELDKLAAGGAKSDRLASLRMQIFEKLDDPDRKLAALKDAVEENPDSVDLLRQLYWEESSRGDTPEYLRALERLADTDQENESWREYLVNVWRGLRNPVRALDAKNAVEKKTEDKPVAEAKKLEPATIDAVKKAVDEGRLAEANSTYRRTWRKYGADRSNYMVFYSFYSGNQGPSWPEKKDDKKDEHSRGGLADMKLDEAEKEPPKPKSAYDALAELDFGRDELRRQVRSLSDDQLQGSRTLLHGLQVAEVRSLGAQPALDHWLELARSGRAGTVDRALLLSYFEDHLDAFSAADKSVLADLVPAVHPLDGAQLRALARIHAKIGETARASRIYQWCATLATSNRWGNDARGSISAYDLLKEVPEQLHGEDLYKAVDAILKRCDPGGDLWERESYVALVIDTWRKIAGAKEARERCKDQLAKVVDLNHGILREPGAPASAVYAATGDLELAARCLEIALCSFTPDQVHFDRDDAYAVRWKLQTQQIADTHVRSLFPHEASDAWLKLASAKLLEWDSAHRLDKDVARRLLAVVAVRLHERKDDASAQALLTRIDEHARTSASQQHIVIDLARLLGREDRARALEDELLGRHALNAERVPEVVERIKTTQGGAKAFELGEAAAEWTPHPKLVDDLIALSTELGHSDRAEHWTKYRDDSLAAAKTLDATW